MTEEKSSLAISFIIIS